jgi:UDP-N-acetylmuramoylalanine--D-glutamate ligase
MIAAAGFSGKSVGVLGLGRSGLSAACALKAGGASVIAWDDKESARRAAAQEGMALASFAQWDWSSLAALVLSPGIPFTHPMPHESVKRAREAGVEVIGDLELFGRAIRTEANKPGLAPVVAVTGTNGKSTTTALIGHILKSCGYDAEIGGNIGRPALDLAPAGARTVYVLEVSSYQADLSPGLVPDIAILSNLSPDHIERHGSMERYAAVKEALLARTARGGQVVVGVDDEFSAAIYTRLAARRGSDALAVSIGKVLGRGIFVVDGKLYDAADQPPRFIADLKLAAHLPGAHNWQNAALAYAGVRGLLRDPRALVEAMLRFPGLAHRIEDAGRIGKVRFVNDSKATNADAAARALACFGDIFWIAGGKPKEGGIASLAPYFSKLRKAYLIGEAAEAFAQTLQGRVETVIAGTLDKALAMAAKDARRANVPEPVVLLSPACASFDQFRDFEERGDIFRQKVQAMIATEPELKRQGTSG